MPFYKLKRIIPYNALNPLYPKNPRSFSEKLRKARMDAGLFQIDLAKMIGVKEETIRNWKRRRIKPKAENFLKAQAFIKNAEAQNNRY